MEPDALGLADATHDWYALHAAQARTLYRTVELAQLVVAALIPTSAVVFDGNATVPAILGAVVVILTGTRPIFHWQENYVRFSQARLAIEAERRLYRAEAPPYDAADTREAALVAAVNRIEQDETGSWAKVAAEPPAR